MRNAVQYFELPVTDLDRAVPFYEAVFEVVLARTTIDGYAMALFPEHAGPGASGALAQGDVYVPSKTGPIVYFGVDDLDATLDRAHAAGAAVLYPKHTVGPGIAVAEIEDSEGNRIALLQVSD
ncbi:MAG: VOC family protein [Burkholderiales bacterium]|jgi:hypothetical protein|nr:VOC family protein [Burkholderiales bacterium]